MPAADLLRQIGWNQDQIDKILAGPQRTSILDLASPKVSATALATVAATSVPAAAAEPEPAPQVTAARPDFGQKQIADAVWASVNNGDPTPLAQIARQLKSLSPVLQAYLLAATRDVKAFYLDLEKFKADFDRAQAGNAAQNDKDQHARDGVAGAATGVVAAVAVAAAAANAVPIVGQAVSAALAIGLAVAVAVLEGNPPPVRKAADQVRPGYEGSSVFYGLGREPPSNPYEDAYLTLKQAVVQDPVAFTLPPVLYRTTFDFTPRLASFQEAAHELRLYPEDN